MQLDSNIEQFDIFIRIVFIIIGVLLAVAFFILALFFLYKILRRYAIKNLEYKRYFSRKGAFEGGETELIEELTNHSFFPMLKVDVEAHITTKLYMPGVNSGNEINQEFISRFFVMPFTKIKRHHKVELKKRGHYKLESAKITFMGIELYLDSRADIYVYPRELETEEAYKINKNLCIDMASQIPVYMLPIMRDVFSFAGVREYTHGDSLNAINHKATAKMGRVMVNDTDYVLERRILLCLNFQAGNTGISDEKFGIIQEKSMQLAAFFAGEALRYGWQIGLIANCRTDDGARSIQTEIGTGYGKYMEILGALSMALTLFGNSIGRILDEAADRGLSGTEVIIFTTYIDESIEKRIEMLEKRGNMVKLIDLKEEAAYENQ